MNIQCCIEGYLLVNEPSDVNLLKMWVQFVNIFHVKCKILKPQQKLQLHFVFVILFVQKKL